MKHWNELKLGNLASGYKIAQKALNRFITQLIGSVLLFGEFANGVRHFLPLLTQQS
ncbi:MAG: hypothetical protein AB3A66_19010 [Nodularia sp. CChRGM 3473]